MIGGMMNKLVDWIICIYFNMGIFFGLDRFVRSNKLPELTPKRGTAKSNASKVKVNTEVKATNIVMPSWATGKSSLKAFRSIRIK